MDIGLNMHADLKLLCSQVENMASKISLCVDEMEVIPRHTNGCRIRRCPESNQGPGFALSYILTLVLNRIDKFLAGVRFASSTQRNSLKDPINSKRRKQIICGR